MTREATRGFEQKACSALLQGQAANGFITGQVLYVCGGTSVGSLAL